MATKVMKCFCEHVFQDKTYGKGNRVYNKMVKDNSWRCTVCGKTTTAATKQA